MPLYEYQCEACAHRFEVIQKFSDAKIEVCPKCGGVVRKLFSSPAIQFKGSGFYITDYARAGKSDSRAGKSDDGGSSAKSESGASESKGESKSDAKTETKTKTESKGETKSESSSPSTPSKS